MEYSAGPENDSQSSVLLKWHQLRHKVASITLTPWAISQKWDFGFFSYCTVFLLNLIFQKFKNIVIDLKVSKIDELANFTFKKVVVHHI
jgi:hypothetical protein